MKTFPRCWHRHLLLAMAGGLLLSFGCAKGSFFSLGGDPLSSGGVVSKDMVGRMRHHQISGKETLLDLTRRYNLGYAELLAANPGIDPWVPGLGTQIVLPTAHLIPGGRREGIVVNLAEQRLYYFPAPTDAEPSRMPVVMTFPIGVSRDGWATPLGETRVKRKRAAPAWFPTASARKEDPSLPSKVEPGPDNPLGTHALYLGWPQYLIHGTNEPDGVGRRVSRGCIRLYPEDIARLFEMTPLETPVRVVDETAKLARIGGRLYLEVHPSLEDLAALETKGAQAMPASSTKAEDLRPRIRAMLGAGSDLVNWEKVRIVAAERRGIPVLVSH